MAGYGVGSDAHIKVQTEALIERAENAKSAISTMENRLNEISQKVLQELKGYPDKLLTISGNYSTVEQANQNESGGLKNNIL